MRVQAHRTAADHHTKGDHAKGHESSTAAQSSSKAAHEHSTAAHDKSSGMQKK